MKKIIKKINKKFKESISNGYSVLYKKDKNLKKYDWIDKYKESRETHYTSISDSGDYDKIYKSNVEHTVRIETYNKKDYENEIPLYIKYYKNGNIKWVKTNSFFNGLYSKTITRFYENGKIKKYIDRTWTGYDSEGYKVGLDGNIIGGIYIEFYDNGNKKCEGFYGQTYYGKSQRTLYPESLSSQDLENMDTDQRHSYHETYSSEPVKEDKKYYKCKLWIYYDLDGDICNMIDWEEEYREEINLTGDSLISNIY